MENKHMTATRVNSVMSGRGGLKVKEIGGAILLVVALTLSGHSSAAEQKSFNSPDAAVSALLQAVGQDDVDALFGIFGREYEQLLVGSDTVALRENRRQGYERAMRMNALREDGPEKMVLLIGEEAWPFPIPIVKEAAGWRFDTAAGADEILNRRIGENELNAITSCRAYVQAQEVYAAADHDGDRVLEYAQRLSSQEGKRDGLYWPVKEGSAEELSPFGPLVAEAGAYLEGRKPGDPFKGYYFKVINRQGANPPGGTYDYVINGNMIAGYALVAYPADYGSSGIMTFVVNHQGEVYEKDLGDGTRSVAESIQAYDPDESWQLNSE